MIGDPTFLGWFTTACYFAGPSRLSVMRARRCRLGVNSSREMKLWIGLAALLLLLGFNKQLDLQTLFTQYARDLAKSQGWYEQRRTVQEWFIAGIAVSGLAGLCMSVVLFRGCLHRNVLALVGVCFLVCFVVVRAASFHRVDALLAWRVHSIPMNGILELSGIGCIILAVDAHGCFEHISNDSVDRIIMSTHIWDEFVAMPSFFFPILT